MIRDLREGRASRRVRRLDVRFTRGASEPESTESFVQKFVARAERDVMRLLEPLAHAHPIARMIDCGEDELGFWILMPCIHGPAREEFSLPPEITRTLAHVHDRFRDASASELAAVPRIDRAHLATALTQIEKAASRAQLESRECRQSLREGVAALRDSPHLVSALQQLPATLLHGDVHPGNIIHRTTDGRPVLIDWGSARLGPAGVDLANCIPSQDLPEWQNYWDIRERLCGNPVSAEHRAAQFSAGRLMTSLQYLPFALEHLAEERAADMMAEALESSRTLQAL